MLKFLKRRLKNQKGATENILVVLLLVIIGVGALIGLSSWVEDEESSMKDSASSKIESTIQDASN